MRAKRFLFRGLLILGSILGCVSGPTLSIVHAELTAAYTFESGTELLDVAATLGGGGLANDDLVINGSHSIVTGRFGQGASVGIPDYMRTVASSTDLEPGPNGFTLALWTYKTASNTLATEEQIAQKYGDGYGYYIVTDDAVGGDNPMKIEAGTTRTPYFRYSFLEGDAIGGDWRHLALTYDGSPATGHTNNTATLYVDGVPATINHKSRWGPNNNSLFFGAASHNPGFPLHHYAGVYDEIALFDEVLSETDINLLMDEGIEQFMGGGGITGDLDGDGDVDGDDFLLWQRNFPVLDGTAGSSSGDANGDGNVDGDDFLVWQRNFPYPTAISSVPEPNSLAMLALGGLMMLRRRSRIQHGR